MCRWNRGKKGIFIGDISINMKSNRLSAMPPFPRNIRIEARKHNSDTINHLVILILIRLIKNTIAVKMK
jgi:hypothetical protein